MPSNSHTSVRSLLKINGPRDMSAQSIRAAVVLENRSRESSHTSARVLRYRIAHQDTRMAYLSGRMALQVSPNFRWLDMFLDFVFPHDISLNSDAATRFNTRVNQVASGYDQRIALWNHPLMEYNVAYGVRTMEQLHDLIRFFRAVRGQLHSFRFLDHLDYTSTFAELEESRAAPDTSPFDQQIGVGNNVTLTFQLRKNYTFETETTQRPIIKPIEGTVSVGVAGFEIQHWTVDHATGIVTFIDRAPVDITNMTLERIDEDTDRWRITSTDPLPEFYLHERLHMTAAGRKTIEAADILVTSPTVLEFTWPEGTLADDFVNQTQTFSLSTNNAPRTGEIVTAGYHFHVPVRFNTDRLPVRLEYYGVGSATEIKLVEVRPDEE